MKDITGLSIKELETLIAKATKRLSTLREKATTQFMDTFTAEMNDDGDLLLNIDEHYAKFCGMQQIYYQNYNGGWYKRITGLNKKRVDGYSLKGHFVDGQLHWVSPGLYVHCGIGGSRKHQNKYFSVFILHEDGNITSLVTEIEGRDWAVQLWPAIDAYFEGRTHE